EGAPVDLLDDAHTGPHVRGHGTHHYHTGYQVAQVGLSCEAGQFDDVLEQATEEEQPDRRLHQHHADDRGLAYQSLEAPVRHPPVLYENGAHWAPPVSAWANRRPA